MTRSDGAPRRGPSWYDDAEAYDLAFAFDPAAELGFVETVLSREGAPPPGRLLEPMVGTARLAPGLERLGYQVTGFDISLAMLRRARERTPTAALFRADASAFALAGVHDAGLCLIDSFRYLLTDGEVEGFFAGVATALRPGAPFLLSLDLAADGPRTQESWTTTSRAGQARCTLTSEPGDRAGTELMIVRVDLEAPAGRRTVHSRMLQRIWTPDAFAALLDGLPGFEVLSLHRRDHDPDAFLPDLPPRGGPIIVVLERAGRGPDRDSR